MGKKVVAIVGRPNVGKSTLFNALSGEKISIVKDVPGVTRDRIYADCEWRGTTFQMIDTGGIEPESEDVILKQMRRQAELAMDIADVIVFITDIKAGVTVSDEEVAQMLRKTRKPVILVCNKCDRVGTTPDEIYEFYNLGLGEPLPISAGKKLSDSQIGFCPQTFKKILQVVTRFVTHIGVAPPSLIGFPRENVSLSLEVSSPRQPLLSLARTDNARCNITADHRTIHLASSTFHTSCRMTIFCFQGSLPP